MSEIAELLERVKAATGPDRKLDGLIAKVVGEIPIKAQYAAENIYGEKSESWYTGGYGDYKFCDPDEYTSSLNAIVALIERELPGWMWVREHSDGHAYVRLLDPEYARYEFMGARNTHAVSSVRGADDNVPLALCAALLAAKIRLDSSPQI